MTANEKAKRFFDGVKGGLVGAALVVAILYVHTQAYNEEVAAKQERHETAQSYSDCKCKPEIKGQQLVASFCQAPTNLGPWFEECFYANPTKGQE